jgi:hypothetical protein
MISFKNNVFAKVKNLVESFTCQHKEFKICSNQNLPSGAFFTIDKKCTKCGVIYIFRRKTTLSPWYKWSKN